MNAGERWHTKSFWESAARPKYNRLGVERAISPRLTIRKAAPLMDRIGVTRIGEVTHLDRSRLPNFLAVRPEPGCHGISYYNGKGATRSQARASAMMEAIERYSGEHCNAPVVIAARRAIARDYRSVNPDELLVPRAVEYHDNLELEWALGFDLVVAEPAFAPLNLVVCPYRPVGRPVIFLTSTNGLASGNTIEDALCHALCEINERDAVAIYHAATTVRRKVAGILEGVGYCCPDLPGSSFPLITHDSLPARPARLLRRLCLAGLWVYLRDVTSDTGIPTILCTVVECRPGSVLICHAGYGCHPDARVAVVRALTEAAQSRVACIQGGREDLPEIVPHEPVRGDADELYGRGPKIDFGAIRSRENREIGDDIAQIIEGFRAAGMGQIVAYDLTRPDLGIPVVKVIVPLAETWSVYRLHSSRGMMGPRSLNKLHWGKS
jgi:ribosomal protein S12 methylthiotransferase accessory factor YcaO